MPGAHLARKVAEIVGSLEVSSLDEQYSSLGRHGYNPRAVLAVWVYASLIGLHHSTKIARALETDAAFRLLSGGYAISSSVLRKFRQRNGAVFSAAIGQTVTFAHERGLLRTDELAVDSMRLRAHASTKAVRTAVRSKKRVEELSKVDVAALGPDERAAHDAKLEKHQAAVARCEREDRPNFVTTNESAALMKFPNGAGMPGHRVTVTAAGVSERLVVSVLVDAATNDYGKLEAAVAQAREALERAEVPLKAPLMFTADAGYCSHSDLAFAEKTRVADVLIDVPEQILDESSPTKSKFFGRERFKILDDQSAICPAGRPMSGPYPDSNGRTKWMGVKCTECPLHAQCTTGKARSLTANLELEHARATMRARFRTPENRERYNKRIATVEPVFSNIEEVMGYRRATSRHSATIVAEVLLKVLAHNISRLIKAAPLRHVLASLTAEGALVPLATSEPAHACP